MRRYIVGSLVLGLLSLAGCCNTNAVALGAKNNTCGTPTYAAPNCAKTTAAITNALSSVHDQVFGCYPPQMAPQAAPQSPCSMADLPKDAKPGEVWCCVKVQPPAAAPERVCVCEEQVVETPIAATYRTVSKRVMISPERTEWQATECVSPGVSAQECFRLVTIPAVYDTITEQVLETPASVRREIRPAQFTMRASPPPPPYWEWRRMRECEVGVPMSMTITVPNVCTDDNCLNK
jgi:hypothetical protein